jgi:predicted membrane protein (TIGR00267 family)
VQSISRRYFISNGFDGALTSVGVIVGAFLTGITDGMTVIRIGLGATVGLGTSGLWSVWEIERAEKRAELATLERALLTPLDNTELSRRKAGARAVNAAASGLGPVTGMLVPLSPFVLVGTVLSPLEATVAGIILGVGLLFSFGAYLGGVTGGRPVVAGLRMGAAGLAVAAVNVFLPG